MLSTNQLSNQSVIVLISGGFEEESVVYCVSQMREQGIGVALVSLEAGLTRSWHGLSIRPDYRISQIVPFTKPRLVVLPGGNDCVNDFAGSPQVHELIENTTSEGGAVAITKTAEPLTNFNGLLKSVDRHQLLTQGNNELPEFVSQLIDFAL